MDLGECMEFFKKIITIFFIFIGTVFAFSKKPTLVLKEEFALIKNKNETCYIEIEKKVSNILDIKKIKISRLTFEDSSFLHLSNQKNRPFEKDNKMQGLVSSNLIFLLHIKDDISYISLVDEKNTILNSRELKSCDTFKAKK